MSSCPVFVRSSLYSSVMSSSSETRRLAFSFLEFLKRIRPNAMTNHGVLEEELDVAMQCLAAVESFSLCSI